VPDEQPQRGIGRGRIRGRRETPLELAERIEDTERRIVDAVRTGSTLRQARTELGYHTLQSRT